MKKIFILLVVAISVVACKKKTTSPTTTNNSADSTKNSNSAACVDNPKINFKSIGTPIGKFGDCIKDVDGNSYKTVTIGSQTWMAENLKVSKYNDGTAIPNITGEQGWSNLTTGAWSFYNNEAANNAKYGKLYNWYAVSPITNGNKNICPTGWRVPSNIDWGELIEYLGGIDLIANKLKEIDTINWSKYNINSNNTSLYSVIPSGKRESNGNYSGEKFVSFFWSQFEYSNLKALSIYIGDANNEADIESENKNNGLSIRCIKE